MLHMDKFDNKLLVIIMQSELQPFAIPISGFKNVLDSSFLLIDTLQELWVRRWRLEDSEGTP